MSKSSVNRKETFTYFDQNEASKTFNNNLLGFINSRAVHSPILLKKWIKRQTSLYTDKYLKAAQDSWLAGADIQDSTLTINELNTAEFRKSCEGIYTYYACRSKKVR